ncbi:hypothetical protein [Streptomyces sp. NBC_00453]
MPAEHAGLSQELPDWLSSTEPDIGDARLAERVLLRLDEFATSRHALSTHGGTIAMPWPP